MEPSLPFPIYGSETFAGRLSAVKYPFQTDFTHAPAKIHAGACRKLFVARKPPDGSG
ncbi:hypothetical protein [Primorskyibacter flagellatus]|uniref:Uncharacterized protein n=1 Tax=Primorskyibacter flagellatus TaxID=1387277 RepID=A0A1W1ZZK6_9RHOB|nr:hypothetical protein [Primorskyibacter flagellatus]SMC53642.1 hypothetical protein SAMN06295998_102265 [Primorskyibacter flagellatus]